MLGPNKWRLLTIVAGILLAHAIDSPNRTARRLNQPPSSSSSSTSSSSSSSSQQKRSPSTASLAPLSLHAPASPTSTHLGLTVEKVAPIWTSYKKHSDNFSERRLARNLYTPFKRFSNIDDVRFIELRQTTGGHQNNVLDQQATFGAFRYALPPQEHQQYQHHQHYRGGGTQSAAGRRSDIDVPSALVEYANTTTALVNQLPLSSSSSSLSSAVAVDDAVTTAKPTTLQAIKRRKYKYIPLGGNSKFAGTDKKLDFTVETTTQPELEIRSRTDLNFYTDDDDENSDAGAIAAASVGGGGASAVTEQLAEPSEVLPQALALKSSTAHYRSNAHISNKVAFPSASAFESPVIDAVETANIGSSATEAEAAATLVDLQGRRSGLTFMQQTLRFDPPYMPKSYQEDDPSHPNFQNPYNEELSAVEPTEIRTARGVHYENYQHRAPVVSAAAVVSSPGSSVLQFPGPSTNHKPSFRDDVTKFGDVDGPITSMQQRQYSDFFEGLRTYENIYYTDDYRRPRQYYPPAPPQPPPPSIPQQSTQKFTDYSGQALRSRLIVPYKSSRTPRVIFPSNDNLPGGLYNGEQYSQNDNVVFR